MANACLVATELARCSLLVLLVTRFSFLPRSEALTSIIPGKCSYLLAVWAPLPALNPLALSPQGLHVASCAMCMLVAVE
jgi:hypothetical protein